MDPTPTKILDPHLFQSSKSGADDDAILLGLLTAYFQKHKKEDPSDLSNQLVEFLEESSRQRIDTNRLASKIMELKDFLIRHYGDDSVKKEGLFGDLNLRKFRHCENIWGKKLAGKVEPANEEGKANVLFKNCGNSEEGRKPIADYD